MIRTAVRLGTLKAGETFEYAEPGDEDGSVFRVVEADEVRPLVTCINTGMTIWPTFRVSSSELVVRS